MKKIPSLFARDAEGNLTTEYHPRAVWVLAGEGTPTRKWDGTATRWRNGVLYARYDAKRGKTPPIDFEPCGEPDPITGHHPGWVPAVRPEDKWIRECAQDTVWQDGTYEACGPKIGGNPERLKSHALIRHGTDVLANVPIGQDQLRAFFTEHDIEGVVWWRDLNDPDCDKVKITGAALGIRRPK